jgi:hypothetical protein
MNRRALPLLLLSLAFPLTGCAGGVPSVDAVRLEIEQRLPGARFERESHIRLGRFTLGLARSIAHWGDPGDPDTAPLSSIHRIEVATYRVRSLPDLEHRLNLPTGFETALSRSGWSVALKEKDRDSRTWIFTRGDRDGALSNLFVVSLDATELTLVRLDGNITRAMADSMSDNPKKLAHDVGGEEGKEGV